MGNESSAGNASPTEIPGLDPDAVPPPKGSTVMVTGANRGIGLALVKEYVSQGMRVIGTTRNPDSSDELKTALDGTDGFMVKCDIMDQASVDAAVEFVKSKVDAIDVLFNNAGGGTKNHPHDLALDMDTSEMERVFKMNVIGTFRMIRGFLPLVQKAANGGRVLNMSSDLASLANNCHGNGIGQKAGDKSSYRLTKCSINMMTRTLACEVDGGTIFVAISPGWVDTRMGSAGGRKPPLSPEQSAKLCADYGNRVGPKDNGRFISVSQEKGYIAF